MTESRLPDPPPAPTKGEVVPAMTLPLDPTGVPNLDFVLGGGLRRGSLMLLVGPPGTGKTTLAGQLAFSAGAAGRRVLVLTALSEPVSKMIGNLRSFPFYDESLIGDQIRFHSLQQFLPQGLASTGRELAAIVRAERARLVVLDGFSGLRTADGPHAVRRFLYELGTALSLQGATTVITSEGRAHDPAMYGETTTADVIVAVETRQDNVRTDRWLEVVKARGTSPVTGRHGFTISANGAMVHPRLEVRVPTESVNATTRQKALPPGPEISFGQPDLDKVFGGGITRNTTTLVVGGPSTGKTFLGLHFATAGATADEPTVFLSLRDNRQQLLRVTEPFDLGSRLRTALAPGGGLTLLSRPPVELDIEVLADELVALIDRTGARRLVIDSIDEWERAVSEGSDSRRIPNHLAALVQVLQARAVTSLVIREGAGFDVSEGESPNDTLVALVENVLVMSETVNKGRAHRVLSLPKLRYAPQDPVQHEFEIAPPHGLRVLGKFRGDAGVLEALAEEEALAQGQVDDSPEQKPAAGTSRS